MDGNGYQYNPANMFQKWIKKSGEAQREFIKSFGELMISNQKNDFDPLNTLKEISKKAVEKQTDLVTNMANMQYRGMENFFNIGHSMPNFLQWGAYKTTVGSNGRISIPEAERDALELNEGDLVQVIIIPIKKRVKERR